MSLEKQYQSLQDISLALSLHRPEMIPFIADCMRRHDAIFLEEPPDPNLYQMLGGTLAVNDYIGQLDVEYPVFTRKMCYFLMMLKAEGKKIFQIEPYLEILLGIHGFLRQITGPAICKKTRSNIRSIWLNAMPQVPFYPIIRPL